MAFNFLKKKEDSPPDVGKEDSFDEKKKGGKKEEKEEIEDNSDEEEALEAPKKASKKITRNVSVSNEINNLEFEKINAKVEAMNALLKGMNERFSMVNQQIGELRAMSLANEKSISRGMQDAFKTIDIVREVKPEKLRIDYQKIDLKVSTLSEKLEANKQFEEAIMNELKDLRKKAGIFVGTEALLKLNEEVKRDLIELQKLGSRVRLNTDKSEEIFVELRKGFTENQKTNELIANLDNSYSGLNKVVEKLKVDYSSILRQKDFDDFRKIIDNKLIAIESSVADIEELKEENEKAMMLIEKTLSIAKRNREDIADIAITIGDDKVKRVSDYEEELTSILRIIDTIAGQVSEIKKKVGISDKKKISVLHEPKKIINRNNLNFKNIEVHPKVSEPLILKKPEISDNLKKIQDSSPDKETTGLLKSMKEDKE